MNHLRLLFLLFVLFSANLYASERPNIVFILADDLGVMDIGAFNPKTFYETPRIDRLAGEGMRFTNAYAACNVCSPTRYSIMSGKYPARSGLTNWLAGTRSERFEPAPLTRFMALEEQTIAEAFREAGYRTAVHGKWHLGNVEEYGPQFQGFEVSTGDVFYVDPSIKNLKLPEQKVVKRGDPCRSEIKTTYATENALCVLEAFKDEPFFMYVAFDQVHSPIESSESYLKPFRKKKKKLFPDHDEREDFAEEEQVHLKDETRRARVRQNHPAYAGMMKHTDDCVGRILDKLDELGLSEKTIVVFMSDNGGLTTAEGSPTSNLPFRCGKGWNYEGGIREPLIVRWPKTVKPKTTCDVPVTSTDFYPTLLELAGLPLKPKQHLDGVSFAPLLHGEKALPDRALFWHYPHYSNQGGFPSSAVRMGDYKLIQRLEDGRAHLYNLKDDVGERDDLAEKMPEKVAEMQKHLFQWYTETGARFLGPKDDRTPWKPF